MNEQPQKADMVSVVLETASVDPRENIGFVDALRSVAAQTYSLELIEVIVADSGKEPDVEALTRRFFASAVVVHSPGATEFELKNLAMERARGEIVAFVDGDCAPDPDWLERIVEEFATAPPDVVGLQGQTLPRSRLMTAEFTALLWGVRSNRNGDATRLATNNCAFRRSTLQQFRFENTSLDQAVDTLLLRRLNRAGLRIRCCSRMRVTHGFPESTGVALRWFIERAFSTGRCMYEIRLLEPATRGAALVRWSGLGWPLLALAKAVFDLGQVWQGRRHVGARLRISLPLYAVFEAALFCGGAAAFFELAAPRFWRFRTPDGQRGEPAA
jgi:cellulose synthase/poly-beta-1,6-N-acetylglucosamine synthase-like glycosyltransferase